MADELRARLRRFGGVLKPIEPSAPATGELRARLKKRAARANADAPDALRSTARPLARDLPTDLVAEIGPEGPVLARTLQFAPTDATSAALAIDVEPLALLARDPRLLALRPRDAVFLDTETTSLSGGAGVLVFMVGLARLRADGSLELRQFFLASPAQERAMLAAVDAELARAAAAVTFFGKSFDRHRLEDKLRIHGLPSHFPAALHADLYHVTRARFGWKLADVRLRTVERSLLGIERPDDLPGSEAPRAYFDYLARKPSPIGRVFEHNRDDVLALAALLARCAAPFDDARAEECLAGGRGAAAMGSWARAQSLLERARAAPTKEPVRLHATRALAEVVRRQDGPRAARPLLEEIAASGCAESTLALARLAWRLDRDGARAAELARLAGDRSSAMGASPRRDRLRAAVAALVRMACEKKAHGAALDP